jgi:hypothetical protein
VEWEIKMNGAAADGDKVPKSGVTSKKSCSKCIVEFNGTTVTGGCEKIAKLNR